jgi:glucosamine-6-phosphate deaminase
MQCKTIISCVPHLVKADAVQKTFANKLTNLVPATMLKQHMYFHLYLNYNSASGIIKF